MDHSRQLNDNVGPKLRHPKIPPRRPHAIDKPNGPPPISASNGGISRQQQLTPHFPANPKYQLSHMIKLFYNN